MSAVKDAELQGWLHSLLQPGEDRGVSPRHDQALLHWSPSQHQQPLVTSVYFQLILATALWLLLVMAKS